MECECEIAGYCPRYGKEMKGRLLEICQGRSGLTPEKEEAYRRLWYYSGPDTAGVGSRVKRFLAWMKIKSSKQCKCDDLARDMDRNGPEWCKNNSAKIIDAMEDEAGERGIPFVRAAAYVVLRKAIRDTERDLKTPFEVQRLRAGTQAGNIAPLFMAENTSSPNFDLRATQPGRRNWWRWPGVVEAFRQAFTKMADSAPPSPEWKHERGIAICGGGWKYFPGAYVVSRLIRSLGCELPIQIWYLGPHEYHSRMGQLCDKIGGVEMVDAEKWARENPKANVVFSQPNPGWQLKGVAAAYSPFKEVMLLDSDSHPSCSPDRYFGDKRFQYVGAYFTPDFLPLSSDIYKWFGTQEPTQPLGFESGQFMVDKGRFWPEIWLANWLNQQAPYVYRHIYGDKDTFLLAWLKRNAPMAMGAIRPANIEGGVCQQRWLDGTIGFNHRIHCKFALAKDHLDDDEGVPRYASERWMEPTPQVINDDLTRTYIEDMNHWMCQANWEPWLEPYFPKSGRIAVDIGAFRGQYTARLARRFDRVIAFEANRSTYSRLKFIPFPNVDVRGVALSNYSGFIDFANWTGDPAHCGGSGIVGCAPNHQTVRVSKIPCAPADRFLLSVADQIDFIKIDVENAEALVLKGMVKTLERGSPKLLIEAHTDQSHRECVDILDGIGYAAAFIPNPQQTGFPVGWLICERAKPCNSDGATGAAESSANQSATAVQG